MLGRPGSGGMLGDIEVEGAQARGGNGEEIDGDERRFGSRSRRETVRSATSMPSSGTDFAAVPHRCALTPLGRFMAASRRRSPAQRLPGG